jgi:NADH-quinone oxidoreductase subunit N
MHELMLIVPELFILSMACVLLLVDLLLPKRPALILLLAQVTVLVGAYLSWTLFSHATTVAFYDQWILDKFSTGLKVVLCALMFVVFTYGGRYLSPRGLAKGEYYVLSLFSLLGMMVLVSSYSLLTLYLGLELLSLPLYVLVAFYRHQPESIEAGIKYFVLGGLASGLMLYGMSLLFGATGELSFVGLQQMMDAEAQINPVLMQFGLVFLLVGLFFKLGAAPFHMWVPDVYAGAPSSVALLIATAPKVAAFGLAYRLFSDAFLQYADFWQQLLLVVAILSLFIGNFLAIAQSNIKRLLGYSAISHMGFILLGLFVGPQVGYVPALTYALIYSVMTSGAFGIVLFMSRAGYELNDMDDLRGLSERSPMTAFLFMLMLFSMAGIPPLVGFYAKFVVLQALVTAGWVWIAVLAVLFSILGAFYYLRVIRIMYFDAPITFEVPTGGTIGMRLLLTVNGLAMLLFGLFPNAILAFCQSLLANG